MTKFFSVISKTFLSITEKKQVPSTLWDTVVDCHHNYDWKLEAHSITFESRPTDANLSGLSIMWFKNCNDFDTLACFSVKCWFSWNLLELLK